MAALDTGNPTILDMVKRTDPDGSIANVVEALSQRNPILLDAAVQEGNGVDFHRVTIRSGLPAVGYRKYNEGVTKGKSTTTQVDEAMSMLEGRSVVDVALAKRNGNEQAFRASEDLAFLQAMNNTQADSLFYASVAVDPEKFHGLTPRFDDETGGANSDNVIAVDTGAAGDDASSIWFITWHPDTVFLTYPKGSTVGISQMDLGIEYEEDASGATPASKFLAYRTHFKWDMGLVVKDWRYVVRLGDIDESINIAAINQTIIQAMINGYNHIYDLNVGRNVIYMSRTVKTWLELQINDKSNLHLGMTEWHGMQVLAFRGIPIVTCDALKKTETNLA